MSLDPPAHDGLEPCGAATGRVLIGVACVFAVLLFALMAMGGLYALRLGPQAPIRTRNFPAPRLEVTIDPQRPPQPNAPTHDARLAVAMAAEAARSGRAYDPVRLAAGAAR